MLLLRLKASLENDSPLSMCDDVSQNLTQVK